MALTNAQRNLKSRKCRWCGTLFKPKYSNRVRKFCSKSCGANSREAIKEISIRERLLDKVLQNDHGCWLWCGSIRENGYGSISIHNKAQATHVEAYKCFVGPIPDGICVLHKCDVRNCINPEHLWLGTKGDNNRDAVSKQRHRYGKYANAFRSSKTGAAGKTDCQ